jgi:hypothetical protein
VTNLQPRVLFAYASLNKSKIVFVPLTSHARAHRQKVSLFDLCARKYISHTHTGTAKGCDGKNFSGCFAYARARPFLTRVKPLLLRWLAAVFMLFMHKYLGLDQSRKFDFPIAPAAAERWLKKFNINARRRRCSAFCVSAVKKKTERVEIYLHIRPRRQLLLLV